MAVWAMLVVAGLSGGCTRAELEHKADAYNQAIAESNNRQILLNAVRASQRAPMSFVGFGDVSATPNFSGAAAGTFNFDPLGLTTYNVNPSLNVNGGFSSFTMNNLNTREFAEQLLRRTSQKNVRYFEELRFPKELVQLVFVQEYSLSRRQYDQITHQAEAICVHRREGRETGICDAIDEAREEFSNAGCVDFPPGNVTVTRLNTGRDVCGMMPFLIFERQLRLLERKLPFKARTVQGILYFLGELIAAQNYSAHEFTPKILLETTDRNGRKTVPLFEVKRGVPAAGQAEVAVVYNGESFFIPKPAFGTIEEARSLQVLDLVSQAITAATAKQTLPTSSTVTLVTAR